jgi:hypothetical protein
MQSNFARERTDIAMRVNRSLLPGDHQAWYRSIMRCCSRLSFANAWVVIYAMGVVWHAQPMVIVPAVFAALVAHGIRVWTLALGDHGFYGRARSVHRAVLAGVLAAAIVGLAGASTAITTTVTGEQHLRDTPLAVFFCAIAILAWRALVRPTPRRTATIAVVIFTAWIPAVVWSVLQSLDGMPQPPDWQHVATRGALWLVVAAGGLVCWVTTLATARGAGPAARLVRR